MDSKNNKLIGLHLLSSDSGYLNSNLDFLDSQNISTAIHDSGFRDQFIGVRFLCAQLRQAIRLFGGFWRTSTDIPFIIRQHLRVRISTETIPLN